MISVSLFLRSGRRGIVNRLAEVYPGCGAGGVHTDAARARRHGPRLFPILSPLPRSGFYLADATVDPAAIGRPYEGVQGGIVR
jgi:hypothetical protein